MVEVEIHLGHKWEFKAKNHEKPQSNSGEKSRGTLVNLSTATTTLNFICSQPNLVYKNQHEILYQIVTINKEILFCSFTRVVLKKTDHDHMRGAKVFIGFLWHGF